MSRRQTPEELVALFTLEVPIGSEMRHRLAKMIAARDAEIAAEAARVERSSVASPLDVESKQVRPVEDVPSLHDVVRDCFLKPRAMTTPPTDAPNAMVTVVRGKIRNYRLPTDEREAERELLLAYVVIAAVLDNLPIELIYRTYFRAINEHRGAEEAKDFALRAARKEILGHD